MPNADTGNSILTDSIKEFVNEGENRYFFESLGQKRYLSMLRYVDGVIGNSSSGLTEAPSMKIGTINIGDRQKGRIQASSILNCAAKESEISKSLEVMYSEDFKAKIKSTINPYGTGGSSGKIVRILKEIELEGLIMKSFNDL
jgi:GDP/UDP-N,N'-diacetylbacillosamine 2-epimerase (hydrolysing)